MVAVREYFPRFTPEEYFAWEEQQECKHEYIDGEVYAMTGGTLNHSEIGVNFTRLIGNHLEGSGCRVLNSDSRVNIHKSSNYVYPDVSVTCDDRDRTATNFISHPCLIACIERSRNVEVLSPTTEAYDRGDKFAMYRRSASLRDYVLVNANKISINLYHKNEQDRWEFINYVAGDSVGLESINSTFPIEQVFRNITLSDDK